MRDCYPASGEEQLKYYCDYIRRRYAEEWDADAVPIYWSVCGDGDAFGAEQAPFHYAGMSPGNEHLVEEDVLSHYYPPVNVRTGEQINWYRDLPVINERFPEFAAALGWLPAPGQLFARLRSIVRGMPQPTRSSEKESA